MPLRGSPQCSWGRWRRSNAWIAPRSAPGSVSPRSSYRGSEKTVRNYLRAFRGRTRTVEPPRQPPAVRRVTGWIMTNPANIDLDDQHDLDAVTAGLTLPWNSGAVEGQVNRIKMLKRQMFGRANTDLLRKRTLLSN